jgi:proteasome lid subunit RPN8/RPN11
MLELRDGALDVLVAHCIAALPHEGCGLLLADAAGVVTVAVGTSNAAASALVYEIDPAEHLRIDREAERSGLEIAGAFHSHTHTEAYPSPTDVAKAVDPSWHWVLVSLRRPEPVVRSFRIHDDVIDEEPIHLVEAEQ